MSRIRTVKPELFLDEDLGALPGDAALLFVGLWTVADREGRLEYRPGRLKAMLFPYRDVDIPGLVAMLEACSASEQRPGKVRRYQAGGVEYLHIPAFSTHQRPHPKEAASILPEPPPWSSREITRLAVKGSHASPVVSRVLSHGEGKEIWEGDLGDLAGASRAASEQAPPRPEEHVLPAPTSGREDNRASDREQAQLLDVPAEQPQKRERKPPKPSRQQEIFRRMQEKREAVCEEDGVACHPEDENPRKINSVFARWKDTTPESPEMDELNGAFMCFLNNERFREQGWPIWLFMSGTVYAQHVRMWQGEDAA